MRSDRGKARTDPDVVTAAPEPRPTGACGRWRHSGRLRSAATLLVLGIAAMVAPGCSGDAPPETSADTAGVATGVTLPDEVGVSVTTSTTGRTGGDTAPTTTSGAEQNLVLSAEPPSGFPSDFPEPDDVEFVVGSATTVGDDQVLSIDLVTTATVSKVVAFFLEAIEDAEEDGFSLLVDETDPEGEPPSAEIRFETDDYLGDVFITGTDRGTAIVMTATLSSA